MTFALTLQQPAAERAVRGLLRITNQIYGTSTRGQLLIHAGVSRQRLRPEDIADFPHMAFGAIVGVVALEDCKPVHELDWQLRQDPYANGPWCWLLSAAKRLDVPVPCRGAKGLWRPEPHIVRAVLGAVA